MAAIYINPEREMPVTHGKSGRIYYRYAYARAAETQRSNGIGQDFIALDPKEDAINFVVCDGVGQSFFGELAAQQAGRGLLEWLDSHQKQLNTFEARTEFAAYLDHLTVSASQVIDSYQLSGELPAMLKEVLEQKRALGSETMFVCGSIQMPSSNYPAGNIFLAWMGDIRLRFWHGEREYSTAAGNLFETGQRWSSLIGPKNGQPNFYQASLLGVDTLRVYSDGLSILDDFGEIPAGDQLDSIIAAQQHSPTSDDISFLEIRCQVSLPMAPLAEAPLITSAYGQFSDQGLEVRWNPIPNVSFYQVSVFTDKDRIYQTPFSFFQLPEHDAIRRSKIKVRAFAGLDHGRWTEVEMKEKTARRPDPKGAAQNKNVLIPVFIGVVAVIVFCIGIISVGLILRNFRASLADNQAIELSPIASETQDFIQTPASLITTTAEPISSPTETGVVEVLTTPVSETIIEEIPDMIGECFLVLPRNGLLFFRGLGVASDTIIPRGDVVIATGKVAEHPFLDNTWLWFEVEYESNIGWVFFRQVDVDAVFLERCPVE